MATWSGSPNPGIEPSVGSQGDSYDNALAESVIGLYKTEVIRKDGPWKGVDAVEFATLDWVSWFNEQRLLEPIGDIPPAEFEQMYYQQQESRLVEAGLLLKLSPENPGRFSNPCRGRREIPQHA